MRRQPRLLLSSFLALAALTWILVAPVEGFAQETADDAVADNASAADLVEAEQEVEQMIREIGEDDLRPETARTPLQAMLGLRKYYFENDYETAGEYLDTRYIPEEIAAFPPSQLVQALVFVWSQQNYIELTSLSDSPEGKQNDGLPSYRDSAGEVELAEGSAPIYLQRVPLGDGTKVWKISNASVSMIPQMWREHGYSQLAIWLQQRLPKGTFLGMQSWQLLLLVTAVFLHWFIAGWITQILLWLTLRLPYQFPEGIHRFWSTPMRLITYVLLFRYTVQHLGLSVTAKVYLKSSPLEYIALTVLTTGVITLWRDFIIRRLERQGNVHLVALLRPLVLIIKIVVVTFAALLWAHNAGFNISTIIAGLGVGSLAIALAAQKTMENVIGAATLYAARPIRPGDFCRFGNLKGTVEEIGLRSVTLRTLDRTVVSVPNSMFSSDQIENISARDRIRFFRELELQMSTSAQLKVILGELRELFLAHPKVQQDTISIRLKDIAAATAVIRIDSGIMTRDYQEFLAITEDLNLRIIELVHGNGAIFSGPGQVLQLRDFYQADKTVMDEVQQKLDRWQDENAYPFPDVSEERKASLKDSLPYPPADGAAKT